MLVLLYVLYAACMQLFMCLLTSCFQLQGWQPKAVFQDCSVFQAQGCNEHRELHAPAAAKQHEVPPQCAGLLHVACASLASSAT
jgi:hypothetical protein